MTVICPAYCKSPKLLHALAVVALLFGATSVFSGGSILFGPEETRIAAGNIVMFVVWFNFIGGFTYVAAAIGLFRRQTWAAYLSFVIAASTALVFAAFGIHIFIDGAFEARTLWAMVLRLSMWMAIACVARQNLLQKS